MVVRIPKKMKAFRGDSSHGGGHKKKRRGAGHRGGRGMAGLHKHKYIYAIKHGLIKGTKGARSLYGFSPKNVSEVSTMNVGRLDELAGAMEKGKKTIDLAEFKINKLLGGGRVTRSLVVKVDACSGKAKAKIEAAGGKVDVLEKEVIEVAAEESPKPEKAEVKAEPKKEAKKPEAKEAPKAKEPKPKEPKAKELPKVKAPEPKAAPKAKDA